MHLAVTIFVGFTLLLCTCNSSWNFDHASHKAAFHNQIVEPYKRILSILSKDIIEYLTKVDIPKNVEAKEKLFRYLRDRISLLKAEVNLTTTFSHSMRQQLDLQIEKLVSETSNMERKIENNKRFFVEMEVKINGTEEELVAAEMRISALKTNVKEAEGSVAENERRLHSARYNCFGKKRRKRRGVWETIKKGFCSLFNFRGIDNAKYALRMAENRVANSQNRVVRLQSSILQLQYQKMQLQVESKELQREKLQLAKTLENVKETRKNVHAINVSLKKILMHLTQILGRSEVFVDMARSVANLETVIEPLMAVSQQITESNFNPEDTEFLVAMNRTIDNNVLMVREKFWANDFDDSVKSDFLTSEATARNIVQKMSMLVPFFIAIFAIMC